MIDVNKITSTLAKLPDQQLQQYAAMHKSDPYTMALAMAESNRRKELRAAGQGAQGAQGTQEQPKVVDQMVAEMAPQQLPEEMGIGQLPAGEMNFAGGGIIAFADGGDVERYQYGGMPPRSLMGDIPGFVAGTGNFIPQAGAPEEVPLLRRMFRDARATGANYQIEQAKARIAAGVGTSADEAILAAAQPARSTAPSSQDMAQFDAASNLYMTERAAKQAAAAAPKPAAAPTADTARRSGPGAAPLAAPSATTPAQAGLGDLAAMRQDILNKQTYTDPAEAGLGELERRELAAAKESKAALDRDQAKFSEAFKGREKRLTDRELDIGKQKDVNKGLAFLNAGLAIMSTPGSLAAAIGKGAQVGTAQFAAGLDKIRSAQERLGEARDRMEELRLNRDEMSAKEIRAAETAIRDVGVNAQKRAIDGIRAAANVNETRASDIYKAAVQVGVTGMEIQGRKEAAQVVAGPGYQRNQMLKAAQGDEAKLRAEYGKLQAKVMDTLSKDANYQMANPTMQSTMYTNALRQAVSTNPFLASYASGIGFSSAPTGKVYDLTED
jgi:hypothetical protein